ncbi:hypothetical protein NIES2109_41940 [Nostoc sp. HK-01]|nr:hypothetical protein [Nostoc cycadae]BAY14466.1 hypothetical protein NIES21_02230 [Anabaenopsis circularis NIES-21]BBD61366.1 hypothetical protein NIES2109_41940 [Nostoc sp. HK-01]
MTDWYSPYSILIIPFPIGDGQAGSPEFMVINQAENIGHAEPLVQLGMISMILLSGASEEKYEV